MPAPFSYYTCPHYHSFFQQIPVSSSVTTLWSPHEFEYLLWCTEFCPCYQGFRFCINLWCPPMHFNDWKQEGEGALVDTITTHCLKSFNGSSHVNWRLQLENKPSHLLLWQQCSISISFFPCPMKHFDPSRHILPDCQSKIICCKKANIDNLVKFVLNSIQGVIIADDWRVVSLHVEKRWSSKTELVNNNKWIGIGFTNLHVNFDGASFEPLISTGHNSLEIILLKPNYKHKCYSIQFN